MNIQEIRTAYPSDPSLVRVEVRDGDTQETLGVRYERGMGPRRGAGWRTALPLAIAGLIPISVAGWFVLRGLGA